MRIKYKPSDFRVEEHILFPGEQGSYAYYRVEKRRVSTTQVRNEMAAQLSVTPSALVFPALNLRHLQLDKQIYMRHIPDRKKVNRGFRLFQH